ncbi:hypothetical protein [Sphingobium sp. SCG-1]|uniref:hypothetical protein n=1 Tax=Sphingobium sp. SCG-1 TaxID=2072936 RepID=UPI0016713F4C|nr:hypothetical protein [Sphingobium sp. SCG-1]
MTTQRDGLTVNGANWALPQRRTLGYAAPLLALLAAAGASYAVVDAQPETQAAVPAQDPQQVAKIAAAIQSDLSQLAPTASVEDTEAAILFVLSQGEYSLEAMEAALDVVEAGPGMTPTIKEAIANVRLALRRKFRRGTAAIPGGGGDGLGGSGFSAPAISVGGGGANYGS